MTRLMMDVALYFFQPWLGSLTLLPLAPPSEVLFAGVWGLVSKMINMVTPDLSLQI